MDQVPLERARRILEAGPICDECFGRAFARVGSGLSNAVRGRSLRIRLGTSAEEDRARPCWVCDDLFSRGAEWAERAFEAVKGIEFDTYLFGVQLTTKLKEMEAWFGERFPTGTSEPMKHAFNRIVGKAFEERVGAATVDFSSPHVSFVINLSDDTLVLHVASLCLYGRYRKLVRGIPQTRWPCRRCRGQGCRLCNFTGKQYPESVEEWIASPLVDAAGARDARLHGAGREDIDARMLGSGRPFVLELLAPSRRSLDLAVLRNAVNRHAGGRIEVSPLSVVTRGEIARIKGIEAVKRYRAVVAFGGEIPPDRLQRALNSLVGVVEQQTPRRVVHRRADRVRRRRLLGATGVLDNSRRATIEFDAEGGLYIKELISGDRGRTSPSLSERLGTEAVVTELDVLDVTSANFP